MDISIVVPTKNRLEYITKLINYYDSVNYSGTLIIVDSSDDEISIKTGQLIKNKKKLNINYIKYKANEIAAKAKICSQLKTKYTIQAGDDDYYSPQGLKEIISFLDNNTDYVSASGYGYVVGYDLHKNKIGGISKYITKSSSQETSVGRIKEMQFHGEVADYIVCKTEIFQKILQNQWCNSNLSTVLIRQYWEYTFKLYSFLYGKSKVLDIFFLVRFIIPNNTSSLNPTFKRVYLKDKKSFFKAYFYVIKKLVKACKNFKEDNTQATFLLSKQKIKNEISNQILRSKLPFLKYLKLSLIKNRVFAIFFKIIGIGNSKIDLLIDKKSKKYKNDFAKIIEGILN